MTLKMHRTFPAFLAQLTLPPGVEDVLILTCYEDEAITAQAERFREQGARWCAICWKGAKAMAKDRLGTLLTYASMLVLALGFSGPAALLGHTARRRAALPPAWLPCPCCFCP